MHLPNYLIHRPTKNVDGVRYLEMIIFFYISAVTTPFNKTNKPSPIPSGMIASTQVSEIIIYGCHKVSNTSISYPIKDSLKLTFRRGVFSVVAYSGYSQQILSRYCNLVIN